MAAGQKELSDGRAAVVPCGCYHSWMWSSTNFDVVAGRKEVGFRPCGGAHRAFSCVLFFYCFV